MWGRKKPCTPTVPTYYAPARSKVLVDDLPWMWGLVRMHTDDPGPTANDNFAPVGPASAELVVWEQNVYLRDFLEFPPYTGIEPILITHISYLFPSGAHQYQNIDKRIILCTGSTFTLTAPTLKYRTYLYT